MAKERGTREASVSGLLEYQISYDDDGDAKMRGGVDATKVTIGLENDFSTRTHPILAWSETVRRAATTSADELSHETDSKPHQAAEVGGFDFSRQMSVGNLDTTMQQNMNLEKPILQILSWDTKEKKFKGDYRRKKRRYKKVEGAKVAANRGYVCEFHRKQKTKCDPDLCPRNKLRLRNILKLAQETPNSDIPSSGTALEKHILTGSGSLSPVMSPPKQTDEEPISSYPNDNATCSKKDTSMFTKESVPNPLHNAITHKASGLRGFSHKDSGEKSACNNKNLELEGDEIGTSGSFNVLAPSTRIYSNDIINPVEYGPRQIPQDMWPPVHSILFPSFVAPNPLLHTSTSEPLVDVLVPLNTADPPFAEGILDSHESDQRRSPAARPQLEVSATELQRPSDQPYSYIEANTELDEEIAALQKSWLAYDQLRLECEEKELQQSQQLRREYARMENEQLRREYARMENEKLRREYARMENEKSRREYARMENEKLRREYARMENEKSRREYARIEMEQSRRPLYPLRLDRNFVLACGGYIMGRVRAFLDFFTWRRGE